MSPTAVEYIAQVLELRRFRVEHGPDSTEVTDQLDSMDLLWYNGMTPVDYLEVISWVEDNKETISVTG